VPLDGLRLPRLAQNRWGRPATDLYEGMLKGPARGGRMPGPSAWGERKDFWGIYQTTSLGVLQTTSPGVVAAAAVEAPMSPTETVATMLTRTRRAVRRMAVMG
jgi:hypothetical protein